MKIVFLTNYYNHHQKALADSLYKKTSGNFRFISTEKISKERLDLGYEVIESPYVIDMTLGDEEYKRGIQYINEAEMLIIGSAPYALCRDALRSGKIVYLYTERMFKKKPQICKLPYYSISWYRRYARYKNCYVLCAGAYTAFDFSRLCLFKKRMYKWGYFPELDKSTTLSKSNKDTVSILWVGRLLEWKHPELVLKVADDLLDHHIDFQFYIVGAGELELALRTQIDNHVCKSRIHLLGPKRPDQVRALMKKCDFFLFTSDRNEGWGAVLNEAMSSYCIPIADNMIGSVPYLIKDGINGLIYNDGDINDLKKKVREIILNRDSWSQMSYEANRTIREMWNEDVASDRLIKLTDYLRSNKSGSCFQSGVCSMAKNIDCSIRMM